MSFRPSRSDRLMIEASHPGPPIKCIVTRDEALVTEYNAELCFGVSYYLVSGGCREEGSHRKAADATLYPHTRAHTLLWPSNYHFLLTINSTRCMSQLECKVGGISFLKEKCTCYKDSREKRGVFSSFAVTDSPYKVFI